MIKNKSLLEVTLNDRVYRCECEPESPIGELHDALCMMKTFVVQRIVEFNKKENEKPAAEEACPPCETIDGSEAQ